MKIVKSTCLLLLATLTSWSAFAQPDWQVEPSDYQYSMTVIAALSADESDLEGSQHTLAAFVSDDSRGIASPSVYVSSIDRTVAFLTVFSNNLSGDQVTFKFYDADNNLTYQGISVLTFTDGAQYGSNTMPVLIENLQLSFNPEGLDDLVVFSEARILSLSSNLEEEVQLLLEVVSGPAEVTRQASSNSFDVAITDVSGEVTLRGTVPDGSFYTGISKEITFNVLKSDQTITFDGLGDKSFGDEPFTIAATSSSNLEVSFEVISDNVTIDNNNKVTIIGAGTATIIARQSGDTAYNAASEVTQSFEIAKAEQIITFNPSSIPNQLLTAEDITLMISSDSGTPDVSISGVATISNVGDDYIISLTGATGNVAITATLLETSNYLSAEESISFNVTDPVKSDQTITFDAIEDRTFGDASFIISASSTANLPVTFEVVSGPITQGSNNELTITGAGTGVIVARQLGNTSFNPAAEVTQSFEIAKAEQIITFNPSSIPNQLLTAEDITLMISSDSGTPNVSISGVATISNVGDDYTISLTGATGNVAITATLLETSNYLSAEESISFNVTDPVKSDQTITFDAIEDRTFGDASFIISASSTANLPVTFEVVSGPITQGSNNELTITGAGTGVIVARQLGNTSFNPAAEVTQSFEIAKAEQIITFNPSSIPNQLLTAEDITLMISSDSGTPEVTISGVATISSVGDDYRIRLTGETGLVTITARLEETANYLSVEETIFFNVTDPAKTDQSITFTPLADKTFGDAPFTISANATSGLPVAFEVVSGGIIIDANNLVTITGAGTATIRAAQVGDDTFNLAPEVTQSFEIGKASQQIVFDLAKEVELGGDNLVLGALASSGLPVDYSISDKTKAEISGNELRVLTEGKVLITAIQSGNDYFLSTEETRELVILEEALSIVISNGIRLYPVPAKNEIFIEGFNDRDEYRIIGPLGIERQSGAISELITISKLAAGTYFFLVDEKGIALRIIKD